MGVQGCTSLTSVFFGGNAPAGSPAIFALDPVTTYYLLGATGWNYNFWNGFNPPFAVLWNPLIQTSGGSFGAQGNQFVINITNGSTNNIPIVLEACTNLANPVWIPIETLTLTNSFRFSDQRLLTNNAGRYYRISAP